jgi:hypothetical protein
VSGVYFTKLFSSITESTVWCEPHSTRIVWITMLAMADRKGRVHGSIPGLANRARVTLEECEHALSRFMSPDKYSRTHDNDGRRIEEIDGGWRLLNYAKYREMRDAEDRAEQNREAQARHREKVSKSADNQPQSAQAEAEAELQPQIPSESGAPESHILPSNIPYREIVALFNEHMVALPRVRELTNKRRQLIRSAWQASKVRSLFPFWKCYFEECSEDPFLNGTGPYGKGHENWRPSFDYLMRNDVITKVYEKAMSEQ